ncbi:MAG: amino acid--tRNA ligase-related protein [Patescibacteria group bacterium]|nr:Elongation factor P-(R)-beta-lysine ligase [Candidatus Roizmanbacteria bacterium]
MKIVTQIKNLENYKIYLQVEKAVHGFMEKNNYLKVDLPVLSPALIPESYLEIFETEFNYFDKKEKLYLTPSPEIFLKRLLVAGVGNCYYLGRAYRNSEPNSDWHSSEFTMLEFYKLGINYLEMAEEVLKLLQEISNKVKNPSFAKATEGKQKLKFDRWEKYSVTEAFEKFAGIKKEELFNEKLFIKKAKNKGFNIDNTGYEDLFSQMLAAEVEPKLGVSGYPTLLYDLPKQMASLAKLNDDGLTAQRCEFYINGLEVGGFCTELNDYKEQQKRFILEAKKRKQNKMIDHTIDKGFVKALKYGLPFCTGAGIGFERLVMIFSNTKSIDELKLISIK